MDALGMRSVPSPLAMIAMASVLVLLTACSSGPVAEAGSAVPASIGPGGVQQITVRVGDDMRFDPPVISVKAGVPVEVTLEGVGNSEHDFSLSEGVSSPVKIVAKG